MNLSTNYKYSALIVKNISEISKIQGELSVSHFSVNEKLIFRQASIAESAHYSTKIEGNTLTLKQVTDSLNRNKSKEKLTREFKEIINYAKAQQYLMQPNIELNEKSLLKSHDILLSGILLKSMRGRYRTMQNAIKDVKTGKLVYLPPQWSEVKILMKELLRICKAQLTFPSEAIIVSGIFHFHFESIHPFIDGNGRLGRLWSTQILKKNDFSFVELSALEKYHEKYRSAYYENLHKMQGDLFYNISSQLDLTPWLEYWSESLLFSAKEAYAKTQKSSLEFDSTLLDTRLVAAQKLFTIHKKLSADQYQLLAHLGRTQAVEDLNKLIKLKFIKKVGGGRSTFYILKSLSSD